MNCRSVAAFEMRQMSSTPFGRVTASSSAPHHHLVAKFQFMDPKSSKDKAESLLANYRRNAGWSQCWRDAIAELESGCKSITQSDDARSRFALQLTNCHLEKSGLAPYTCLPHMSVEECTKPLVASSIAFQAYTEFTLHVDTLCYYIQGDAFSARLEDTINELHESSQDAILSLNQISTRASSIQDTVAKSLEKQYKVLANQEAIQSKLKETADYYEKQFSKIQEEFGAIRSISSFIKGDVDAILHEQSIIAQEQQQQRRDSKDHFETLHGLARTTGDELNVIKEKQLELHDKTQQSLGSILDKSSEMNEKLREAAELQQKLHERQHEAQKSLEELRAAQERAFANAQGHLTKLLKQSEDAAERISEYQASFREKYSDIFASVEKILHLQSSIFGRFFAFDSFLLYAGYVLLCLIFTSWQRTSTARAWTLGVVVIAYFLEWVLYFKASSQIVDSMTNPIRWAVLVANASIIAYHGLTWRDPNQIIPEKLQRLEASILASLQSLQQQLSQSGTPYTPEPTATATATATMVSTATSQPNSHHQHHHFSHTTTTTAAALRHSDAKHGSKVLGACRQDGTMRVDDLFVVVVVVVIRMADSKYEVIWEHASGITSARDGHGGRGILLLLSMLLLCLLLQMLLLFNCCGSCYCLQ
eukprot:GEZU01026885.1.p1 GENE.GEZU01026885.1~~GEZU01026885.1.p1  ORF type:complete len:649 (-),score=173.05 GEZU01026885.1:1108-3054(-)